MDRTKYLSYIFFFIIINCQSDIQYVAISKKRYVASKLLSMTINIIPLIIKNNRMMISLYLNQSSALMQLLHSSLAFAVFFTAFFFSSSILILFQDDMDWMFDFAHSLMRWKIEWSQWSYHLFVKFWIPAFIHTDGWESKRDKRYYKDISGLPCI